MPQIKIVELYENTVKTKDGPKTKWTIVNDKKVRFDAWIGKWNSEWKKGQAIEVDESQVEKKSYVDKKSGRTVVYYQIKAPASAKGVFNVDLSEVNNKLDEIIAKLNQVQASMVFAEAGVETESVPTSFGADEPPEWDDDDNPF